MRKCGGFSSSPLARGCLRVYARAAAAHCGTHCVQVIVFCCCAVACLVTLAVRRMMFGGELGGPFRGRIGTFLFFNLLWGAFARGTSGRAEGVGGARRVARGV